MLPIQAVLQVAVVCGDLLILGYSSHHPVIEKQFKDRSYTPNLRSWLENWLFHTNSALGAQEWLTLDSQVQTPFSKQLVLNIPQT